MRRNVLAGLVAGLGLVAACSDSPPISAPTEQAPAPLLAAGRSQFPDRYIVVFKANVADVDRTTDDAVRGRGAQVRHRYRTALRGFAGTIPAAALDAIRRNPNVEFVEVDAEAQAIVTQTNPPSWGLDRIDQRSLPLSNSYTYDNDGTGVRAYILDTGIRYTHVQFGGRAVTGPDFVDNDALSQDCHGHGTHVAGTVGGNTTGVAKNVALIGIRVLNCQGSGSYSGIIAAVDYVTAQQASFPAARFVGNMSIGGPSSSALNTAVNNSVAQGVVWAVAAGNENGSDACTKSPAAAASALTVGATGSNDARASFSNIGTCLDLFAPGVGITSSTFDGDATYASWSGTSMASPHVAGVAALYRSANPGASASAVNAAVVAATTPGVVGNPGTGSPNRLLYSLFDGAPPPPPTAVHSGDLDGSTTANGSNWKAVVTVEVHNVGHSPVSGATVSGTWSTGGNGSCVTTAGGRCNITSANFKRNTASTTFTVTGISGTGLSYSGASNHDPDAGNGTVITITR